MVKRIIIKENQYNKLLIENRASKNQSLARKVVRSMKPNVNDIEYTENVLHDIPNVRMGEFHLYPAIVRMVIQNENNLDSTTLQKINQYLLVIAPKAKEQGYNQDLNGMSLQEFFDAFKGDVEQNNEDTHQSTSKYGQGDGKYNGYDIVPIKLYEDAKEYNKYTDWCVTESVSAFNQYTNYGLGMFYFLLKEGFENVEKTEGENVPLDEYGLSMIAVSFDEKGDVKTITCRWNHANGGSDHVMSPEQLSKLIGADIYSIFNPEDNSEEAQFENLKVLKNISEKGILFCQDTSKNELCVCDTNMTKRVNYKKKKYVVFNSNFNSDVQLTVLDRNGDIIRSVDSSFATYDEFDNVLIVSSDKFDGFVMDTNSLDIILDNVWVGYLFYNTYVVFNNNRKVNCVSLTKGYILFDEWIDNVGILNPIGDTCYSFCTKGNKCTLIDLVDGEIVMSWVKYAKISKKEDEETCIFMMPNGDYWMDYRVDIKDRLIKIDKVLINKNDNQDDSIIAILGSNCVFIYNKNPLKLSNVHLDDSELTQQILNNPQTIEVDINSIFS